MRDHIVVLGLLGLAGCGGRDPVVVARIGDHVLPVERLAELMVLAQPLPLTRDVAYELASHWVQWNAFAARMADGDSLLDSAAIIGVMWHPVRQEIAAQWRQRLLTRAGAIGDAGLTARFDSVHARQLLLAKGAQIRGGASATVRGIAAEPWGDAAAQDTLATFAGGALTGGDLRRHVQYLSPATRGEMVEAGDQRIVEFLSGLVLQEVLLAQAESAGVRLSPLAFQAIAAQAREAVHALWRHTDLSPVALASAGSSASERAQVGASRVEQYLDAAAARRVPLEPVAPFLAVAVLREVEWEIATEGLHVAVQQAQRLLDATRK